MTDLSAAIDKQVTEALCGFLEARDPIRKGQYAKLALVALWRGLRAHQRGAFLNRLDGPENDFRILEWRARWPKLNDATLEAAMRSWEAVARDYVGDQSFDGKFAQEMREKMAGKGRWANWTPSDKQQEQIKRLYRIWRDRQDVVHEPWLEAAE